MNFWNCANCVVDHIHSRVAERVAPQASLAPAQAPLARGALSERLVPPFLQSVHSPTSSIDESRLVPPFLQSVHSPTSSIDESSLVPPFQQSVSLSDQFKSPPCTLHACQPRRLHLRKRNLSCKRRHQSARCTCNPQCWCCCR